MAHLSKSSISALTLSSRRNNHSPAYQFSRHWTIHRILFSLAPDSSRRGTRYYMSSFFCSCSPPPFLRPYIYICPVPFCISINYTLNMYCIFYFYYIIACVFHLLLFKRITTAMVWFLIYLLIHHPIPVPRALPGASRDPLKWLFGWQEVLLFVQKNHLNYNRE